MTILSFAMLARFVAPARQLRASDLAPAQVWAGLEDRVYRGWERTVKFYENLKVVYQIQTKLQRMAAATGRRTQTGGQHPQIGARSGYQQAAEEE